MKAHRFPRPLLDDDVRAEECAWINHRVLPNQTAIAYHHVFPNQSLRPNDDPGFNVGAGGNLRETSQAGHSRIHNRVRVTDGPGTTWV